MEAEDEEERGSEENIQFAKHFFINLQMNSIFSE